MSEVRIPLTARSIERLTVIEKQIAQFNDAKNAILTGILDHADVEVTKDSNVRIEGTEIIVSTPDAE